MRKMRVGMFAALTTVLSANATLVALSPDADVDIRSKDLANIGYDRTVMLVGSGGADPTAARSYKSYVRFELPADFGTAIRATFTMTRSYLGAYDNVYTVSMLNDSEPREADWLEQDGAGMGTTWNNAPGNMISSSSEFSNSVAVGAFTSLKAANGGVVGDSYSLSGTALVEALNADTNGFVTLLIGRAGVSSSVDQWASSENGSYAGPQLELEYVSENFRVNYAACPVDLQLYPRDRVTDSAVVEISGTVANSGPDALVFRVFRDDVLSTATTQALVFVDAFAPFSFSHEIAAETNNYDFEVLIQHGAVETLIRRVEDVVAGDVYLIEGQSNADARLQPNSTSANENIHPFIRVFGRNTDGVIATETDLNWRVAQGDGSRNTDAGVGQWGLRMARLLLDQHHLPIAILNGAHGGKSIDFFQRNDSDPGDTETNYGRLLYRARAAGLTNAIRSILWYQGENEWGDGDVHETGMIGLYEDWHADYPTVERVYIHQLRVGCGVSKEDVDLRDRQRLLPDRYPGISVMSTTGIDGHDGCHFLYANGYKVVGNHIAALMSVDLYGSTNTANTTAPNIDYAYFSSPTFDEITVVVRNRSDSLGADASAGTDFLLEGSSVAVTNCSISTNNLIVLMLGGDASDAAGLTYTGHEGSGAWVTNAGGVGLLTFYNVPLGQDDGAIMPVDMTLYAGDDAVVKSFDSEGNYGTDEHLEWGVRSDVPYEGVKSYFRFRLPEGAAENITSAALRLTRSSVGPHATYPKLYALNDNASGQDWAESAITWNNAPANRTTDDGFSASETSFITQGSLSGSNDVGAVGQVWSIHSGLTNLLNADTDQWLTFMVEWGSVPDADAESFAAKEHETFAGPMLEITYTAGYKDVKTLASERWHAWRQSRDYFPSAAWSYFFRYLGDEAEYQMYADAGLNLAQVPYNQAMAAMSTGMGVLLGSWEFLGNDPAKLAHYIDYPEIQSQQVAGYLLYDEPSVDYFDELAFSSEQIYRLDERGALPIIDLLPNYAVETDRFGLGDGGRTDYQAYYETYINKFVEDVSPCVMMNSHYPIMYNGSDRPYFYMNIEYFRRLALENDIGLMGFALANRHLNYRESSESDLNWMVYSYLAYGAQGIFYYNYRIGDPGYGEGLVTEADGTPHATYFMAQDINAELNGLWPILQSLKSTAVFHTGTAAPADTSPYVAGASAAVATFTKDNFIIGDFVNQDDAGDTNRYVMLVNKYHWMNTSSADAACTAVFTANSNYPYVSMFNPSTGEETLLQADSGTYRLIVGGGKGALLRFAQQLAPGLPVRVPDADIDPVEPALAPFGTVLTPDADIDIRAADLANNGYDRSILLISNLGADLSSQRSAKAYVRFKLPDDFGSAIRATFSLSRTLVGSHSWLYNVSLLDDGIAGEADWVELDGLSQGTTWNNAPGNDASSASLFTNSTLVGIIQSLKGSAGGAVGDHLTMIDTTGELAEGLNADSNGYVSLMIGRLGVSSSSDQWASKEYADISWAPTLTLEYNVLTNYSDWIRGYPGVGPATNRNDNPDGDSLNNLAEFGLGGNPDNPDDTGHATTVVCAEEGGTNWFYYVYPKRRDAVAAGLTYYLQRGTNLLDPSWAGSNIEVLGSGVLNAEFITVSNRVSIDAQSKQFLRLIIESNDPL